MYGPTGLGILYGKREKLEAMDPYQGGGEMISTVTLENSTYAGLPHKFEAGTPHVEGIIGFGAALKFINEIGIESVQRTNNHFLNMPRKSVQE